MGYNSYHQIDAIHTKRIHVILDIHTDVPIAAIKVRRMTFVPLLDHLAKYLEWSLC